MRQPLHVVEASLRKDRGGGRCSKKRDGPRVWTLYVFGSNVVMGNRRSIRPLDHSVLEPLDIFFSQVRPLKTVENLARNDCPF